MRERKEYLGDSVYAIMLNDSVMLTTDNGFGPSNKIILEPEVVRALLIFLNIRVRENDDSKITPP